MYKYMRNIFLVQDFELLKVGSLNWYIGTEER